MPKATSKQPSIAVVTPVFNEKDTVLNFLKSISETDYQNVQPIIVDMGTDDTKQSVAKEYPNAVVLKEGDIFWSGGTNAGVKYALKHKFDYIFTINDDVVVDSSIFRNLIKCATAEPQSLIGCKIYYMNDRDKVWYFGGHMDDSIGDVKMANGRDSDFLKRQETGVLTGMGVLIPAEVFTRVGLYDAKNFPHYLADSDFSLRAKAAGYKLIVDPDCKVYSDVASSWLRKQLKRPTPRFVFNLFFHRRSPQAIQIRWRFYKRYWPKQKLRMMFRYYWLLAKKMSRPNAVVD